MSPVEARCLFADAALALRILDQRQHRQAIEKSVANQSLSVREFFVDLFGLTEAQCEEILRCDPGRIPAAANLASRAAAASGFEAPQADTSVETNLFATLAESAPVSPPASENASLLHRGNPRYRVIRPHAEGGLGKISMANDLELARVVAVKELLDQHADAPEIRTRFLAEAKITGILEHPGVVPVYGLGVFDDGRPYYAMRFIQGTSLKQAVDQFHREIQRENASISDRRSALRKLLGRFAAVCLTIEYAHSRRVIHRDLKPQNIMLGSYGETLVVDWGLAKSLAEAAPAVVNSGSSAPATPAADAMATHMGDVLGTPQFMSPEQAAGRVDQVGAAADVYSLGATLYYLLTGRAPFTGATSVEDLLQRVADGRMDPPRSVNSSVPKPLEAVCLKAMALSIEDRYTSARALADDLERFMADEPVSVYRESWSDRVMRWSRRHRAWFQAASLAALVVIGVLALAVVLIDGQRKQAERERRRAEGLVIEKTALAEEQRRLRQEAQWQAARRSLEQSIILCSQDAAAGLLALAGNLQESRRIGAADLEASIRCQMGQWSSRVSSLETAQGMPDAIRDIVAHPDGRTLLVCLAGQPAQWFDAIGNRATGKVVPHDGGVLRGAFNREGTVLATAGVDNTIRLWDVASNSSLGPAIEHTEEVVAVGFSPDGRRLLSASGAVLRIWRVVDRKAPEREITLGAAVSDAVFSPVAEEIYTSEWSGVVRAWDADSGAPKGAAWALGGPVVSLAIHPRGTILAAGETGDRVSLWDVALAKPFGSPLIHQGLVGSVDFSADGRLLLTSSADQQLRAWDVATGRLVGSPMRQIGMAASAVFLRDSKTAVSGGADRVLRRWKVVEDRAVDLPLGKNGNVVAATYCATDDSFVVLTGTLRSDSFVLPGELHQWRVSDAKPVRPSTQNSLWGSVAAISNQGMLLCATLSDAPNQAQVWGLKDFGPTGRRLTHSKPIKSLAFSGDDRWIATGSEDQTVQIWDAQTGEAVGSPLQHEGRVSCVSFFPVGGFFRATASVANERSSELPALLTGSWDQSARVWAAGRNAAQNVWQESHSGVVTATAVSPDSSIFATASSDGSIRLWSAETGRQIGGAIKHAGRVSVMRYCGPQRLLVGAADGTLQQWDLGLRESIGDRDPHSKEITALAVSSDNAWAVAASADWSLRRWPIGPWRDDPAAITARCMRMTNMKTAVDGALEALKFEEWSSLSGR